MSQSITSTAHMSKYMHHQVTQPSIFDVLSSESLMNVLNPAMRHVLKFIQAIRPNNRVRYVNQYYEELYLLFDFLLQNHFLKNYDASFAENFYGFKRLGDSKTLSPKERIRSIVILVIYPYLKRKTDDYHERLNTKFFAVPVSKNCSLRDKLERIFYNFYPYINSIIEFSSLLFQIGYIFGKTSVHSPFLLAAGVKLYNLTADDHVRFGTHTAIKKPTNKSLLLWLKYLLQVFPRAVAAMLFRMLGFGLFITQFLEWYVNSNNFMSIEPNTIRIPPPQQMTPVKVSESLVLTLATNKCPLCGKKRTNDTILAVSGYVFCYGCIVKYVDSFGRCPVTQAPATKHQLIRMFLNI